MQHSNKYFARIAFAFVLTVLTGSISLKAQSNLPIETLYLKDGSMIRGTVMEFIKGDHVLIKKLDGSVVEYSADQVRSIKQSGKLKMKGNNGIIAPLTKGYYNISDFGMLFRSSNRYGEIGVSPTLEIVNGYQFMERFQTGIGVGMDILEEKIYFPVFLDLRYNFRKQALSPFVNLKAGYVVSPIKNQNDYYGRNRKDFGGPMAGIQAGLKVYTSQKFGITCGVEYRFAMLNSKFEDSFWNGEELIYFPMEEKKYTYRFGLRVGIFFH